MILLKKLISVLISLIITAAVFSPALPALKAYALEAAEASSILIHREYCDENGVWYNRDVDGYGNPAEMVPTPPELEPDFRPGIYVPSAYDSRENGEVTSVKNQYSFGTCWAHGFCAAAESNLISMGYATKDTIDLSEAHLARFSFNTYDESKGNPAYLDSYNTEDPLNNGGSCYLAAGTVMRGAGFTTEAKFPYSSSSSKMNFDTSCMEECDYELLNIINYNNTDREKIKKGIMFSGAVAVSYYSDSSFYCSSPDGYCYYQNIKAGTNHLVTVVGWDDDFPASSFSVTPPSDGAWLIKNSWGTGWGDSGYFWLSYRDPSLSKFCEVRAVPAEHYDRIYQYDGIYTAGTKYIYAYSAYAANVFTAENTERIKKTYFKAENSYLCDVSIYTDLQDPSDPLSGTLRDTKTFICPSAGYYSADWDTDITVEPGEKFSAVVRYYRNSNSNNYFYIPFEKELTMKSGSYFVCSADEGQSFYSGDGVSWTDAAVSLRGNIPIKVYTQDYYEDVPDSISILTYPSDRNLVTGTPFNPAGLSLKVHYPDGREKTVTDGYKIIHTAFGTGGLFNVTVLYKGLTADFAVNVYPQVPVEYKLRNAGSIKMEYNYGEKLVFPSNFSIRAVYRDGSYTDFREFADVTGYSPTQPGNQNVVIHLLNYLYTFTVHVSCRHHYEEVSRTSAAWDRNGYIFCECSVCHLRCATLILKEGQCGENVFYSYNSDTRILDVTGSGPLYNYAEERDENPFFNNAYIKYVKLGKNITGVPADVFQTCRSVESFEADERNTSLCSIDGVLFSKDVTELIKYPPAAPAVSYTVPGTVQTVGGGAFAYSENLTSVSLPEGLKEIGEAAFSGCVSLTGVTLPESLHKLKNSAFFRSGITEITVPARVYRIEDCAFASCPCLRAINVSAENKYFCSDENGILYNKNRTALLQCPAGNGIKKYIMPDCVESISQFAFYGNPSLKYVTFGSEAVEILFRAFDSCTALRAVTFGESVVYLDESAFAGCTGLETVFYRGTPQQWSCVTVNPEGNDDFLNAEKVFGYTRALYTDCTVNGGLVNGFRLNSAPSAAEEDFYAPYARQITCVSPNGRVSTGDTVRVEYTDGYLQEYTVVIYGDINGDGLCDATDTVVLNCLICGALSREAAGPAVTEAADCCRDGVLDSSDRDLLEQAGLLLSEISQLSSDAPETSSVYEEYLSLIDQNPVIETSGRSAMQSEAAEAENESSTFDVIIAFILKLISYVFGVSLQSFAVFS